MDFERSLVDQIQLHSHTQSAAVSNPYDDSSVNLPLFQSVFSFCKEMVHLGSDDISGHVPVQLCQKI